MLDKVRPMPPVQLNRLGKVCNIRGARAIAKGEEDFVELGLDEIDRVCNRATFYPEDEYAVTEIQFLVSDKTFGYIIGKPDES